MTTIKFPNGVFGSDCVLTTEHAASSYGVPVLVAGGQAYGPGDRLEMDASFECLLREQLSRDAEAPADRLEKEASFEWLYAMESLPAHPTAGDLVRVQVLEGFGPLDPSADLVEAAKLFLSALA